MSTSSDDILNQRRLRAAEMALETARRRRMETDESVRALRADVANMEATLVAVMAARERDQEAARRAQLVAEQGVVSERTRRLELERQLGRRTREDAMHAHLMGQLTAEARIRELEAELEFVVRQAAEFEYGIRMAAFDAFTLVRDLADRVVSVLESVHVPLPELRRGRPDTEPETVTWMPDLDTAESGYGAAHPASTGMDSERLDAALERLRASTPPPAEDA